MLVLTRKVGEQVIIADNIRVTVVSVGPGRVKIGIEAPETVTIDRAEVHEKKRAEQATAQVGPPAPAGEAAANLHNRISGLADGLPAPTAVVTQTPPPRVGPAAPTPAPPSFRSQLSRKPR